MGRAERKGFGTPDEVRQFPKGKLELVNIGAWVVGTEPVVLVDWWGASNYARKQ